MVHDCKDKKLIDGSVPYFESNRSLKSIYVSEDGQYFETVSRSNYHCKQRGLKLFRIDRSQIPKNPAPKAPEKPKAPEVKAPEAKAEAKKAPEAKKGTGTAKKPQKSE